MNKPVFSIICVYNNRQTLKEYLLKGLEGQTRTFELITIDNTGGEFKSAAKALNHLGNKAAGEFLVFIHQDVRLQCNDWLEKAEQFLRQLPDAGIAGIAGVTAAEFSARHIAGPTPCGHLLQMPGNSPCDDKTFSKPEKAETLDEQVLIIPKTIFEKIKFDADACGGWHLYGVDYAISAARAGLKAYFLPLPALHGSKGFINADYCSTLAKLFKKYPERRTIPTTCGIWHRSNFVNFLSLLILSLRSDVAFLRKRNTHGSKPYRSALKWFLFH